MHARWVPLLFLLNRLDVVWMTIFVSLSNIFSVHRLRLEFMMRGRSLTFKTGGGGGGGGGRGGGGRGGGGRGGENYDNRRWMGHCFPNLYLSCCGCDEIWWSAGWWSLFQMPLNGSKKKPSTKHTTTSR